MTIVHPNHQESPIRYRSEAPDEFFDTPEDEYKAVREFVRGMEAEMSAHTALDTILTISKIFEFRGSIHQPDSFTGMWYTDTSRLLRKVISLATHLGEDAPRPDIKYEDDTLYWPDMKAH